jgi:hypothetical protein
MEFFRFSECCPFTFPIVWVLAVSDSNACESNANGLISKEAFQPISLFYLGVPFDGKR